MDEKSIFNKARKIPDSEIRDEYLNLACGDNTQALNRIQELLAANADDSSFLEKPLSDLGATESLKDEKSRIGERIGPYKLLQEIGEGGMGSVYMAEQTEPVKRRVALKIIKPGMDTRQVIARFEAERQALALMDHPNIARLLDVGTTDSGRPYFVMELVKGVPITEYCDDKRLSVKQRLELFTSVCNAVQHAHQKGIIHRDLKPSNILVAEYDDKVVSKIIDFGLAKALSQSLTDKTVFTQFGQVVGTFAYMSPEQSKMNQLDVDTRTDIYSLGVLLYELLIGTTPFDSKRFKDAAIDQILRMIREEDPPKPSTRLSSSDSKPEVADKRNIDCRRLSILMRGDLDWIVMRAMEKDRANRYETVNGLGMDVNRFLAGEPTLAAPPSARYRLKKFLKRNRVAVIAGSLIAASLLIGLVGTSSGFFWALTEKTRAENAETEATKRAEEAETVSDYQAKIFEKLDAEATGEMLMHNIRGSFGTTVDGMGVSDDEFKKRFRSFSEELSLVNSRQVVSKVLYQKVLKPAYDEIEPRFNDQPVVANKLRQEFAKIYRQIGNYDEALLIQEKCIEFCEQEHGVNDAETISARLFKAQILEGNGDIVTAEKIIRESIDELRQLEIDDSRVAQTLARALRDLAQLTSIQGRFSESQSNYNDAINIYRNDLEDETGVFVAQIEMLRTLEPTDREPEAIKLGYELLPKCEEKFGPAGDVTLLVKSSIARALLETLNWREAEPLLKDVLNEHRQKSFGNFLSETLIAEANYIRFLMQAKRIDEAIQLAKRNLDKNQLVHGANSKEFLAATNQLGLLYQETRDYEKAAGCYRLVIDFFSRNFGESASDTISSRANLAVCLRDQKKYPEAEKLLRQCIKNWGEHHGKKTPEYYNLHQDLAQTLAAQNQKAEAIDALAKLFEELDDGILLCHLKVHTVLDTYVNFLHDLGRHKKAISVRKNVWQAMEKGPGENHPDTLRELYLLANSLERDNQLKQAATYCQTAFSLGREIWGPESIRSMVCQRVLARVHGKLGKTESANKNFRENIDLRRQVLGETESSTIGTTRDYVTFLFDESDFESAEKLRKEVVSAILEAESQPDGKSCWELNRLGQKFEFKRKDLAAEECYRLAFNMGENAWDRESNQFMVCQRMLARIEGQLGKFEEAQKRFQDSIRLQSKARSEGHIETIETIRDFGHVLFREELYPEAESQYGDAWKLAAKSKGPTARATLSSRFHLANSLREQGKLADAEKIYRNVVSNSRKSLGDKDPYTLAVMSNLGRNLALQSKKGEATELLSECLACIDGLESKPDWIGDYQWQANVELGKLLLKQNRFKEAESNLNAGYQGCTNWIPIRYKPKRKLQRLYDCVDSLVELYESWHRAEPNAGHQAKAAEWQKKRVELNPHQ